MAGDGGSQQDEIKEVSWGELSSAMGVLVIFLLCTHRLSSFMAPLPSLFYWLRMAFSVAFTLDITINQDIKTASCFYQNCTHLC